MKGHLKRIQILLTVLIYISISACSTNGNIPAPSSTPNGNVSAPSSTPNGNVSAQLSTPTESTKTDKVAGELKVSFIDVGQADSMLIQNSYSSMLIDAGNNSDADTVVNFIRQQGITKIDYVVGTHPHEDHIGGMDAVVNTFDIGKIYMPKVTATTKTFQDVITAIKNKGLPITTPIPDSTFDLGDVKCTIIAPNSQNYTDLNNYSIVIRMIYGRTSFLFEGDAQIESEQEMLSKGFDLHADVLKVGHHGSDTSTSPDFLKAVSPKYAVISVGKGNDYGHPKQVTLDKLNNEGVQVFRTDVSGTIIATSNGDTIKFDKNASAIKPQAPQKTTENAAAKTSENVTTAKNTNNNNDIIVYITNIGTKYHVDGCRYLARSKIPITLSEVKKEGYTPCSVCHPPQ